MKYAFPSPKVTLIHMLIGSFSFLVALFLFATFGRFSPLWGLVAFAVGLVVAWAGSVRVFFHLSLLALHWKRLPILQLEAACFLLTPSVPPHKRAEIYRKVRDAFPLWEEASTQRRLEYVRAAEQLRATDMDRGLTKKEIVVYLLLTLVAFIAFGIYKLYWSS